MERGGARMSGDEMRESRELLGLSHDGLAAELGLTPAIVVAWERNKLRIPRRFAELVRWRRYIHERETALASSGLPLCGWVQRFEAQPPVRSTPEERKRLQQFLAHADACPTCQARRAFVQERFPDPPSPPLPGWVRFVNGAQARLRRFPTWSRPAIAGAAIVGALTILRIALLLPAAIGKAGQWSTPLLTALGELIGGLFFGAVIGAVWGAVVRRRRA